jgi:hypothetical protein
LADRHRVRGLFRSGLGDEIRHSALLVAIPLRRVS